MKGDAYESYPLAWPAGYRRHVERTDSRFGTYRSKLTLYRARTRLREEVGRLGAEDLVISTNMKTRTSDGEVYSGAKEPTDPGVAIYFKYQGASRCLCADQYKTVRENTYALALTIEAMRGMDRWGASDMLDRIFTGFKMLPAPSQAGWWEVLDVKRDASIEQVRSAYRKKMMDVHPDRTQAMMDQEASSAIERAWENAKAEKGVG